MQHFVFLGPPGTGKTAVARIVAKIFYAFGLLEMPTVVEAQRSDLVGEYLGATAIKTNELIDSAPAACCSSTRLTAWSTRGTGRTTGSATRRSRRCSSGPKMTATGW